MINDSNKILIQNSYRKIHFILMHSLHNSINKTDEKQLFS
jgi:hypothetical protein